MSYDETIKLLVSKFQTKSFLEIGIGSGLNANRLFFFETNNVKYTGVDFKSTCESHQNRIIANNFNFKNIQYKDNICGSYVWTLYELVRLNNQYDMIYLDGHHTLYVDLPAAFLANLLLKPGGILLFDDIGWKLSDMKNMLNSYKHSNPEEYEFYEKIYTFDSDSKNLLGYTKEQQNENHVLMIAELFLEKMNYNRLDEYCHDNWWTLQKS